MTQWSRTSARSLSGSARSGPSEVRHQVVSTLRSWVLGLADLAFALDAEGLAATVESRVAVPLGAGDVDHGTAAALDAPVPLVEGFERGRALEVDGLEVIEHGLLVVLDRRDDVVGAAFEQPPRGLVLSVHRVQGDDAAGDVDAAGEVPHGGDRVALRVDLDLAEDRPRTMPVPCSTAATLIRRPFSVCLEAPRRSLPSMASGVSVPACWAVHRPMAWYRVSGGRPARMVWKVVDVGAV